MGLVLIKRSMSPDGKIDSVSVELTIEAEVTDTQAVMDAIDLTDTYSAHVLGKIPAPKTNNVTAFRQPEKAAPAADGEIQTLVGVPAAVYKGEKSKTTGKNGPGSIIVNGIKVKSFDGKVIEAAATAKVNGQAVEIEYVRNEQWKSNDVKTLKLANA